MLPESIKAMTGQMKRLAAVRDWLRTEQQAGRYLTVTEILMEKQPEQTHLTMGIDGHILNGTVPAVDTSLKIDMPEVRLMSMDEKRPIRRKVRRQVRIPGTDRLETKDVMVDLGHDVTVPHHVARDILYKWGWPVLQNRTGKTGYIVEVGWLEMEAARPDTKETHPEIADLYDTLKPRIEKGRAAPQSADRKGKVQ